MFHAANLLLLMLKTHGGLYNSSGLFKSRKKKKKKKTLITAAVGFIFDMTTLRETLILLLSCLVFFFILQCLQLTLMHPSCITRTGECIKHQLGAKKHWEKKASREFIMIVFILCTFAYSD